MSRLSTLYFTAVWWALALFMTLSSAIMSVISYFIVTPLSVLLLPALAIRGGFTEARRQPFLMLFALAFLLLGIAFTISARQPHDILFVLNFAPMLLAAPVYVVATWFAGAATLRRIVIACIVGVTIAVVWGLNEVVLHHYERASGILTGALIYSRAAMLFGFVAGAGSLIGNDPRRYLFLLGPVLGVAACVLGGARGVLLCAPFLLLLLFVFLLSGRPARERWTIVGGVLAVCMIAAGAALLTVDVGRFTDIPNQIVNALTGHGEATDLSTRQRLDFYAAGWQLFTQSPLFGYGWANFRAAAWTIVDPVRYADFFSFHNDFLNFAVAGGILGIASWLLMLAAPIAGALASPHDSLFRVRLYAASIPSILYALGGLTDYVLGFDMPTAAFAFMTAIIIGAFREPRSSPA
ncbi:MAG TPA: O-antigen ligase family protein [Devosia sp.]|nr:O-antigen ligase family protein [Devosia sp.]